jgi:hypothetical protein
MARQRIVGGIILSLFLAAPGWAQTTSPSIIATSLQPAWTELTVPQKIILAPLSDEWDSLESFDQKKWMGIAAHFPSLSPGEQRRLQGQMQKWRKLTSEERQVARENYKSAKQLPADKRKKLKQKWEEYSSLPEEEKEKLKKQVSGRLGKSLLPVLPVLPATSKRVLLPGRKADGATPPHTLPSPENRVDDGKNRPVRTIHTPRPVPRNLPPIGRFYWFSAPSP